MNFTLSLITASFISHSPIYIKNHIKAISYFSQKFSSLLFNNQQKFLLPKKFQNILKRWVANESSKELEDYPIESRKVSEPECFQNSLNKPSSYICKISLYLIYALSILIAILLITIIILSILLCKKPKVQNFPSEEVESEAGPILNNIKSNDDPFYVDSDETESH